MLTFLAAMHETSVTEPRSWPYMIWLMFTWLKAKDAVDAGAALADSFPVQTTSELLKEFVLRAARDVRARQLNFYKRVRFANALKWRLLEKGVPVETAHDVTQTILIESSGLAPPPAAAA